MFIPMTILIRPNNRLFVVTKDWADDRPFMFIYRGQVSYNPANDSCDTDTIRSDALEAALKTCLKLYEDKPEMFARKPLNHNDFIINSTYRGTPQFIRAPGDEDG